MKHMSLFFAWPTSLHFSRGGLRDTDGIECMQDFIDKQETARFQDKPIMALACSRALASKIPVRYAG
jgi:hypothetical protein